MTSPENFQAFLEEINFSQDVAEKLWNGNIRSINDLISAEESTIRGLIDHPVLITILKALQDHADEIITAENPCECASNLLRHLAENEVEGTSPAGAAAGGDGMLFMDDTPSESASASAEEIDQSLDENQGSSAESEMHEDNGRPSESQRDRDEGGRIVQHGDNTTMNVHDGTVNQPNLGTINLNIETLVMNQTVSQPSSSSHGGGERPATMPKTVGSPGEDESGLATTLQEIGKMGNGQPMNVTVEVHEQNEYNFPNCSSVHVGDKIATTQGGSTTQNMAHSSNGDVDSFVKTCNYCEKSDHLSGVCLANSVAMMQSMLNERARCESKKMTIPIKPSLKINEVPLQLTSKVSRPLNNLDRKGHYNKRSDFDNVLKASAGNVELPNVFKYSTEQAEKRFLKSDGSGRAEAELHSNIVALIGQAGIGKTTLTRMMLRLILQKDTLPETKFIFYIPFRQVNFKEDTTLLRFVLTGCTEWQHTDDSDRKLLKMLQESPNVVFIFDGLDEADTDLLHRNTPLCNQHSTQKADLFLAKILTGNFFPKAKKLITSRPRQFFELHPEHRPLFTIDILGLDKDAKLDMCKQICKDLSEDVMKYLELNPDISACCYVPVNCIITMSILHDRLRESGAIDVQSLTDIFVQALDAFVRTDHVREKREEVWKLGQLAWKGFLANKIVFDESDIKDVNIDEKAFQAFLCTYVKGEMKSTILQGDKKSSFTHLTWQELFVAIHVMVSESLKTLKDHVNENKLNEPLWEIVSKFMFGLCNSFVMDRVETVLHPKVPEDWDLKKKELCKMVRRSLESPLPSSELFRLFNWIHEANDRELNETIQDVFPTFIDFEGKVFPTDIVSATYFMKFAAKPWNVRLDHKTDIDQDGFNLLCKQITLFPHKVQKFSLLFKNIPSAVESLSLCVDKIEELYLCYGGVKSSHVATLARKIATFPQPIKKLDLSCNNIGNEGLASIAGSLGKIDKLYLRRCGIKSTGVAAFVGQLKEQSVEFRMKTLDLSGNDICDDGQCLLGDYLQRFETLELRNIGIKDAGVKSLAKQVAQLVQPIKLLDLGDNLIGDAAATSMAGCLQMLKRLDLDYCDIGTAGVKSIHRKLSALPDPKPIVLGLLNQRNARLRPKKK